MQGRRGRWSLRSPLEDLVPFADPELAVSSAGVDEQLHGRGERDLVVAVQLESREVVAGGPGQKIRSPVCGALERCDCLIAGYVVVDQELHLACEVGKDQAVSVGSVAAHVSIPARCTDRDVSMLGMRKLIAVALLVPAMAACGGQTISDSAVGEFKLKARADVPYMERYHESSDYRTLLEAICGSLDQGQSYKLVSRTVAAYIDKEAYEAEVDSVIKIGHDVGCPKLAIPS